MANKKYVWVFQTAEPDAILVGVFSSLDSFREVFCRTYDAAVTIIPAEVGDDVVTATAINTKGKTIQLFGERRTIDDSFYPW